MHSVIYILLPISKHARTRQFQYHNLQINAVSHFYGPSRIDISLSSECPVASPRPRTFASAARTFSRYANPFPQSIFMINNKSSSSSSPLSREQQKTGPDPSLSLSLSLSRAHTRNSPSQSRGEELRNCLSHSHSFIFIFQARAYVIRSSHKPQRLFFRAFDAAGTREAAAAALD